MPRRYENVDGDDWHQMDTMEITALAISYREDGMIDRAKERSRNFVCYNCFSF